MYIQYVPSSGGVWFCSPAQHRNKVKNGPTRVKSVVENKKKRVREGRRANQRDGGSGKWTPSLDGTAVAAPCLLSSSSPHLSQQSRGGVSLSHLFFLVPFSGFLGGLLPLPPAVGSGAWGSLTFYSYTDCLSVTPRPAGHDVLVTMFWLKCWGF